MAQYSKAQETLLALVDRDVKVGLRKVKGY